MSRPLTFVHICGCLHDDGYDVVAVAWNHYLRGVSHTVLKLSGDLAQQLQTVRSALTALGTPGPHNGVGLPKYVYAGTQKLRELGWSVLLVGVDPLTGHVGQAVELAPIDDENRQYKHFVREVMSAWATHASDVALVSENSPAS